MIKKALDLIKDNEVKEAINHLQENAQGNPLDLGAAPTATTPLLEDGEEGIYSDVLYKRQGGTILVFTPSSTITIS